MANPHLSKTLVTFEATVQRTKNRLVAITVDAQKVLGLVEKPDNDLLHYSIRLARRGPWYPHVSYLTKNNEFSVPADAAKIQAGDRVEVKVHRVIANQDAGGLPPEETDPVLQIARELEAAGVSDPRNDGSLRHDDYLIGDMEDRHEGNS